MYTPPKSLVRAVHAYDPRLRVRWAHASHRWSIECRMPARHPEFLRMVKPPTLVDTTTAKIAVDRYEAMQASYFPVLTVPKDQGHRVEDIIAAIRENDAAAQGSMTKINDALDAAQALWEAQQAKAQKTYVEDRAAEADTLVQWAGGHKIATPMSPQESVASDRVVQMDGFRMNVRRGLHRSVA
jgi:hypothetical protein